MERFKFIKKANEDDYCIFDLAKESKYSQSGVVDLYDIDLKEMLKNQHGAEIEKILQDHDGIFWDGLEVKSWEGQIKWKPDLRIYNYGVEFHRPFCNHSATIICNVTITAYNIEKWDSGEEYEDEAGEYDFQIQFNLENIEIADNDITLDVGSVYAPRSLEINSDLSAKLVF